jgi:hypothetical protein
MHSQTQHHMQHHAGCFIHCTHWTEGWVVLRANVDIMTQRKIPAPSGNKILIVQLKIMLMKWYLVAICSY